MQQNFNIKKGKKTKLFDEQGNVAIPLDEYYWYLTTDTAEVFVAIRVGDNLELKKINEVDTSVFDALLEDFEERLSALEASKPVKTFAEYSQFPTYGLSDVMYVALDKAATFVWSNGDYIKVGSTEEATVDINLINGGSAVNV